jgi:hypothetical protein
MSKRTILVQACKTRRKLMKASKGRTDWSTVEVAVMFMEQFLLNYPYASNARVTDWCLAHYRYLDTVLTPAMKEKHWQYLTTHE